eukprot:TRINITY_DN20223_c0_g3_i1.p1 TRINITY_DN20223_c0_g3~~TRINITY_DN20223_c0_g3_i1.p1  ORF type:complete len:218 (+),score=53.26 TRINITY_DN20223_c0_g3_i1:80-733(+)
MACGFGISAVRALSRKLPSFRSPRSTGSERNDAYAVPDDCDKSKLAAVQPSEERRTLTTFASFEGSLPASAIYSDNEEDTLDGFNPDGVDESEVAGLPTRTETLVSGAPSRSLTLRDVPDPSQFLDASFVGTYTNIFMEGNSAKISEDEDDSDSDVDSSSSSEQEELDEFPAETESDCEQMYAGPLPPKRTTARRDFPLPSEYLTKEELTLAMKFYD